MKIAYFTGDIGPNGNYSFCHDLLVNFPKDENERHRVYLVGANWDVPLLKFLKERYIEVEACFQEFQDSTDAWWDKLRTAVQDCDVIISGNITNLDEVVPDRVGKPVISVSLAEVGYRTRYGTYGSFYKERFHKVAVSKTAKLAFPEHVRHDVTVLYSGIDAGRITPYKLRNEVRQHWYGDKHEEKKILLFIGAHQDSKGLRRSIDALHYLPQEWDLLVLSNNRYLANVPEKLKERVKLCPATYYVGDIYKAVDCLVLPTDNEGFSMSLLESWFLEVPTVTTRHKTILELQEKHPKTDLGQLVEIDANGEELAKAIRSSEASQSAYEMVCKNYTAQHMVERWKEYLNKL